MKAITKEIVNAFETSTDSALYKLIVEYLKSKQSSGGLRIQGLGKIAEECVELLVLSIKTLGDVQDTLKEAKTPEQKQFANGLLITSITLMHAGMLTKLQHMIEENVELLDDETIEKIKANEGIPPDVITGPEGHC
jgi:hypothetical protein